MIRQRLVSLSLEIGWMVPWLFALHAGRAWWIVPAAGLSALFVARISTRGVFGPVTLLAAMGGGALLGGVLGAIAAGIAWWRGWAAHGEDRPRLLVRLVVVLIALGILVLWHPGWWWILAGALLLAVAGLAEAARPEGVSGQEWWTLGTALAVVSLGVALVVYGLAWWGPWKHLTPLLELAFQLVVEVAAALVFRIFKDLHLKGRVVAPKVPQVKRPAAKRPPMRYAGGHHVLILIVLGVLGAAALAWGAVWLSRALARWQPPPPDEDERVERKKLPDREVGWQSHLTFTRRVVAGRMRRAVRRRYGPRPHETLREWLLRVHGEVPEAVVRLYEEVRYAGAADSADRAERTRRRWPREP